MDNANIAHLIELVNQFTSDKLDADSFEKLYTDIFDFEDWDDQQLSTKYFSLIRSHLEHYSFSNVDLEKYPNFYINASQLKERIIQLKSEYSY
jgi:hypothetical protein